MIDGESQETDRQLRHVRAIQNLFDRKRLIVSLLIISLPFTVWGAREAWYSNTNEISDWLPETLQATQDLKEFMSEFGSDELLMISWDGCSLEDPRVDSIVSLDLTVDGSSIIVEGDIRPINQSSSERISLPLGR